MRFQFIADHRKEFDVDTMCQVLQLSRSGYYAWRRRPASPPGPRRQRQQELSRQIQQVHQASRQIYGSPRIHRELKARQVRCCENTVAKYMQQLGLRSRVRRRFIVHTTDSNHPCPIADNLLERRFDQPRPDRAWCADLSYIPTAEGWLYLAVVMDLCSRRIIGWATADHLGAALCLEALQQALDQRQPSAGLLHHSDRGVQYACEDYQHLLQSHGVICSMSGRGNCYDNAAMESFFGSLKREWVYHQQYQTRDQARQSLFEYIEVFYNRKRRHSTLGYVSPVEFEASLN